ncbi:MAG TPA: GTP-binding protein [Pirellulaceae bacterium]|nr:GTP-binding protein [Pirellulaceae bacterium]
MSFNKTFSHLILLLALAAFGAGLIYFPSWIIEQYHRISSVGAVWGALYLIVVGVGTLLLVGSALWIVWKLWGNTIAKRLRSDRRNRNPSQMSNQQKSSEIDENLALMESLKTDNADAALRTEIDPLVREMVEKRQSQTLEIVAFGTISSGKSSVLNLLAGREVFATDVRGGTTTARHQIEWPGMDRVVLVDTPGLGEIDGEQHVWIAADSAKDADLVLLVVDGPLRESEHQLLQKLASMEKRIVVCLNKSDWYQSEDRQKLVGQIQQQTRDWVEPSEIVSVQSQTGQRIRRRVLAAGDEVEESVAVEPDIEPLAECLLRVLSREGKELLLANVLLQSRGLLQKAKDRVQESIDERARRIVDKYMWTSAGVAAVNPFPIVDLIAGVGISTKMVLDLAEVYQQRVDLETASKWIGQMGKVLIGVVGYTGASVAVAAVVASLLKVAPVFGTLAGNALQGTVQALLTKWVGAVFVEYFRNQMQTPEGGLAGLARREWDKLTTLSELRKLIQTARERFSS